jgi:hypothetical protein
LDRARDPDANGNWRNGEWANRNDPRPITVTADELYQLYRNNGGSVCWVFGVKGCWKAGAWNLLSIDRIDPAKGYVNGNNHSCLI